MQRCCNRDRASAEDDRTVHCADVGTSNAHYRCPRGVIDARLSKTPRIWADEIATLRTTNTVDRTKNFPNNRGSHRGRVTHAISAALLHQ